MIPRKEARLSTNAHLTEQPAQRRAACGCGLALACLLLAGCGDTTQVRPVADTGPQPVSVTVSAAGFLLGATYGPSLDRTKPMPCEWISHSPYNYEPAVPGGLMAVTTADPLCWQQVDAIARAGLRFP